MKLLTSLKERWHGTVHNQHFPFVAENGFVSVIFTQRSANIHDLRLKKNNNNKNENALPPHEFCFSRTQSYFCAIHSFFLFCFKRSGSSKNITARNLSLFGRIWSNTVHLFYFKRSQCLPHSNLPRKNRGQVHHWGSISHFLRLELIRQRVGSAFEIHLKDEVNNRAL